MKYTAQTTTNRGIHASLTNVQNGEQPRTLNPVQSSEDARKPRGIAAINNARLGSLMRRAIARLPDPALTAFAAPTPRATMTNIQNGAANHHGISLEKSIAKRISRTADIATPNRSNHC